MYRVPSLQTSLPYSTAVVWEEFHTSEAKVARDIHHDLDQTTKNNQRTAYIRDKQTHELAHIRQPSSNIEWGGGEKAFWSGNIRVHTD